ncbi:ESX secretion-associated protein EspG [Actinokineospora sp.]|uniref:ESX secretion-associated protein EspG n=1 Tax=Actinokineospora sp. TaxID=1872133 RepID=UPI004037D983
MVRVECSFAELDAVGAALDLPVWRFPFTAPRFGGVGRVELLAAVHTSLSRRGLVREDQFAPELVRALRIYATGRVSVAINGLVDRTQLTALAVLDRSVGVLAELREERIAFRTVPAERVVRALVGTVAPLRPGLGRSVTVTGHPPAGTVDPSAGVLRAVRARDTHASHDHQAARRILIRPRHGGGSFLISTPARLGQPDPSKAVSWVDTDEGRYTVVTTTGSDGGEHVTYQVHGRLPGQRRHRRRRHHRRGLLKTTTP